MAMNHLPLAVLTSKDLRNTQAHRHRVRLPFHMSLCPLNARPVSEGITCLHRQYFKAAIATRVERHRVMLILRSHLLRTLLMTTLRPQERRRRSMSHYMAKWLRIAVHIGSSNILTVFHKLLEVMQIF